MLVEASVQGGATHAEPARSLADVALGHAHRLAQVRGLIALHVTGETLIVATAVGFIALFGVSVQNGIIMVANFRRVHGEGLTLSQTVIEGASERLRPVLMTATVASIDLAPTITSGVSAYKTTLNLNGSDSRIRAGMTANATILGRMAENVIAVPSSTIIAENGGDFVLVQNSGSKYSQQKVEVGISGGGYTEITSGLSAGQLIATFGQ